jgi:DNA polymerase III alpha subunit
VPIGELSAYRASEAVAISGLVEGVKQITTRGGEPMLFAQVADLGGRVEIVVFPSVLKGTASLWRSDTPLLIAGRLSDRDGDSKVLAETVEELKAETFPETVRRWRRFRFPRRALTPRP